MSDKVTIVILAGSKKISGFMQACDMFEPSKIFAKELVMTATKRENFDAKTCVGGLRRGLEEGAEENVAAIVIQGHESDTYINPQVQSVSDGSKWFLLSNWLQMMGVPRHLYLRGE